MRPQLDSLIFSRALYDEVSPRLSFGATALSEARAWQEKLGAELVRLLGDFPEHVPLRPVITGYARFPTYTRERVTFWSRPHLAVTGWFILPNDYKAPGPAILCCPGHGRGADDIVGIEEDGSQRKTWGGYQNDFALQAASHGFAAFAIEQLGFGRRRDPASREQGRSSCQPASGAALLLGQTMIGWRVWDAIRALDYLQSRPEVDPERIGIMGISGGGTTTLFASALEPRLKVAMISGYLNLFVDSIFSLKHCMDNYVPGLLQVAEMPDVAGLIAPRPVFVESGTRDPIFPVRATREALNRLREVYRVFGAEDRLGWHIFRGEHVFSGRRAWPFLKRWL